MFGTADSEVKPGKGPVLLDLIDLGGGAAQIISMNQTNKKLTSEGEKCNQDEKTGQGDRVCWGELGDAQGGSRVGHLS